MAGGETFRREASGDQAGLERETPEASLRGPTFGEGGSYSFGNWNEIGTVILAPPTGWPSRV